MWVGVDRVPDQGRERDERGVVEVAGRQSGGGAVGAAARQYPDDLKPLVAEPHLLANRLSEPKERLGEHLPKHAHASHAVVIACAQEPTERGPAPAGVG